MTFRRTQVYLDPDDHRILSEEAARRGTSLTALLREIVSAWSRRSVPASSDFSSLIGFVTDGEETDIERLEDAYKADLYDSSVTKILGRDPD